MYGTKEKEGGADEVVFNRRREVAWLFHDALTFTYLTKQPGSDLSTTLNDIWIF